MSALEHRRLPTEHTTICNLYVVKPLFNTSLRPNSAHLFHKPTAFHLSSLKTVGIASAYDFGSAHNKK
jgi:hypothetical protein